jgi:hypothetical protein
MQPKEIKMRTATVELRIKTETEEKAFGFAVEEDATIEDITINILHLTRALKHELYVELQKPRPEPEAEEAPTVPITPP